MTPRVDGVFVFSLSESLPFAIMNDMLKPQTGELVFFWILFGVVGLVTFTIMSPYLTPLFMAGVFTILFAPIHARMGKWLPGRPALSALATVGIVLVAILIPLIFLGVLMFQEVLSIYGALSQGNTALTWVDGVVRMVEAEVQTFVPNFQMHTNIYAYFEAFLRFVASHLNTFFSGILSFIFQLFIILVAMFFMYRDGKQLRAFALKWSPLSDDYDASILAKIESAVSSVVTGALTTAIVQGVMVGIGFALFGIPNPVLWGTIATIAALIPLIGTGVITMPAGAWLILTGNVGAGVGLIIWGLVCVGLVDNVLNPYMMKRGMDVHPFLILLSVFGGIAYFGPVGFLAGPIVLAFFFALLEIYPQVVKGKSIPESAT
jgi:predicted PurR-regulated permease PerM